MEPEKLKDLREKTRKRIDELLQEKRFDEAAALAVNIAFVSIPPEELVKVLLDAIKKMKEEEKK